MKKKREYTETWMNSQTKDNKKSNRKSTLKSFFLGFGGLALSIGLGCILAIPMSKLQLAVMLTISLGVFAVGTTYITRFIRDMTNYICDHYQVNNKNKKKEDKYEKTIEKVFDRQKNNAYIKTDLRNKPKIINLDEQEEEESLDFNPEMIIEA